MIPRLNQKIIPNGTKHIQQGRLRQSPIFRNHRLRVERNEGQHGRPSRPVLLQLADRRRPLVPREKQKRLRRTLIPRQPYGKKSIGDRQINCLVKTFPNERK